ncbi:MAG: transcriptional repressor LexA [Parcubacteria group bacterium]|nr:transcriptional repressor LexA [Parcubacteria group bacterium]
MPTLTKRQKQILDFIREYINKHNISPTFEEIKKHFRLSALSTVHQHIEALIKKEFLVKNNNLSRGLELKTKGEDIVEIPLLGVIAAGQPIEVFEEHETITVPRTNLSNAGEHFALKVQGNSMIDEGIFNGDTVIIRKQNTASNGETIVAIINGNEATLKKIYRFQNGFRLQPANPEMKPIFVKSLLVQGKVVSVIRNFENNTIIEQISSNEEYIVSKEYSEKGINLDQLISELVNFRDIIIFKYGFNTADDFLKTQIIDGLILQEIFKHIANKKNVNTNIQAINEILKELNLNHVEFTKDDIKIFGDILKKYNFSSCDDDVLGFIYQSIRPQSGRKDDGQYYTPKKVVKYILNNVKINLKENKNLKILDPACGSGQFLLETYDILYNQYKTMGEKNEADIHYKIINNHLLGFDIDKIAVSLAKLNLFLKSKGTYTEKFNILITNTLKRDSNLLEPNQLDKYKGSIDFVVGNPPWGANLNEEQKKYYKKHYDIGKNGLNTFTLFIERAFDFLKKNGKLGYLIPEAYLKIKVHQLSRLQILNRAKILLLGISGDIFQKVYAPCLVIIFQQEKDKTAREKNEINIENGVFNGHEEHKTIIQKNFEKSAENIFNINQVGETEEILNHILEQKNYYLKDNALFILGIVTGNNKKYLIREKKDNKYSPIIVGKDISKYKINFSGNYFIYDKNILQQIAPKEYYTVPEKIIYKFIGEKITFAYDDKQYFTLNNANAFVPKIEKIKTKYILALLNSKLMQFFYNKSFFTVRVLRGNLEKLPLVYADQKKQEQIISLVNQAINSEEDRILKIILDKIDDEVFSLYKISKKWQQYICKET